MMKTGLVWFKNNLRVNDNNCIVNAQENNDRVIGVFFFDPKLFQKDVFGFKKTEKYRALFLLETVVRLKQNLLDHNITLLVYHDSPENVIPSIVETYSIKKVYLQKEWTSEELDTLQKSKNAILSNTIEFIEVYDQFLYHPDQVPFEISSIPKIFTAFRKKCEKYGSINASISIQPMDSKNLIENITTVPSTTDLGFSIFESDTRTAFPYEGGETEALKRLQQYFWDTKKLSYYKKTRNGLIGTDYSSKFSPWLANGSISARTIYHKVRNYEKEVGKNESTYWLLFELIWRDFFKYISLKHKNKIFKIGGILDRNYEWNTNPTLIKNWIDGETNEPFVNANMIELQKTGWMSNRGRQNVASYFAKELQLDWRIGAAYFESMLIDYDVHSNYGNWMYVAGVGNDPRDRKFNIKLQAERYDANQKFQNLWLQTTLF